MAVFTKEDRDNERLDWELMIESSIKIYYSEAYLNKDLQWLRVHGYHIVDRDFAVLRTYPAVLQSMGQEFGFPGYFSGSNLDVFYDFVREHLHVPYEGGLVIVMRHYDLLVASKPRQALAILDILDCYSRDCMRYGHRLITLIQSDDPNLRFDEVGAQDIMWSLSEPDFRKLPVHVKEDLLQQHDEYLYKNNSDNVMAKQVMVLMNMDGSVVDKVE